MTEFLNTELKPYNALTREEKEILLLASLDGQLQFWCAEFTSGEWLPVDLVDDENKIYRTNPIEYKKLDIPWQYINDNWKYAAMDKTGDVWFYEVLPVFGKDSETWSVDDYDDYAITDIFKLDTTGIVAKHSLTQRPEGE